MRLSGAILGELQKKLSGMSAGFTLSTEALYVRYGDFQIGFVPFEVVDHSIVRCHCCGVEMESVEYWGKSTLEIEGQKHEQKVPVCYDCAVPQ